MSLCAHYKSAYKIRKLPICYKCEVEFILVMSAYSNRKQPVYEWECPKCHKIVPKELLREGPSDDQDIWLSDWCKKNKERKWTKSIKKSLQLSAILLQKPDSTIEES